MPSSQELLPPIDNDVRLHHVGYVVKSIAASAETFALSLGLTWDGEIFFDPVQQVRVSFFRPPRLGDAMMELIEPVGNDSPVYRSLERGGGLHHLCYEVASLERQLALAKAHRDLIVRSPQPAVAFGQRRIAWVYTQSKLLVEYLERLHS